MDSCDFTICRPGSGANVDALLKQLNDVESHRAFVEGFLAAPFEKALARARVAADNYMFGSWGSKTLGDARKFALDGCGKKRPLDRCAIVMENNNWVGNSQ
jgi:hypothetical protein